MTDSSSTSMMVKLLEYRLWNRHKGGCASGRLFSYKLSSSSGSMEEKRFAYIVNINRIFKNIIIWPNIIIIRNINAQITDKEVHKTHPRCFSMCKHYEHHSLLKKYNEQLFYHSLIIIMNHPNIRPISIRITQSGNTDSPIYDLYEFMQFLHFAGKSIVMMEKLERHSNDITQFGCSFKGLQLSSGMNCFVLSVIVLG